MTNIKSWITNKLEVSHGDNTPLRAMEGLRGVAVLLVFFVHFGALIEPWLKEDSWVWHVKDFLFFLGHTGVDLFFLLSGYLIYGTIIRKDAFSFIPYFKRRITRIYPTFLVVFAIYVFLSFVFPSENKFPDGLINKFIYITQNIFLLPGLFHIKPLITVAIKVAWGAGSGFE